MFPPFVGHLHGRQGGQEQRGGGGASTRLRPPGGAPAQCPCSWDLSRARPVQRLHHSDPAVVSTGRARLAPLSTRSRGTASLAGFFGLSRLRRVGHRQHLGGIIYRRRNGNSAHWGIGDGRVHRFARLVATKRNARCVYRNFIRSQRAEFCFWNYISVRHKKTDPRFSPPIRLPHSHLPQREVNSRTVSEIGELVDFGGHSRPR